MAEKKDLRSVVVEIKDAYDLGEYMESVGLNLRRAGSGKRSVCCPFHTEKTPSCVINEQFQNYHCFGCGAKGDIINFVMAYENLSFMDALEKLADAKGISIELNTDERGVDYRSMRKVLELTKNYYIYCFNQLPENHPAHREITERNLKVDNKGDFPIKYGYAPEGNQLYKMLKSKGFNDEILVNAGVCRSNTGGTWDFFNGRLMFILEDFNARPVGFTSRKLREDDPIKGKYVNSPDCEMFHKSRVLYNHPVARKATSHEKLLYICEGQFDVAAMVNAGLNNVVAASGTAYTHEHVRECLKMVGDEGKLVFCFDGDEAGLKAANKVFLSYPEIHDRSMVVMFPGGQDPCDYFMKNGGPALVEYVTKNRQELPRFALEIIHRQYTMDTAADRSNFVKMAARLVKSVNDGVLSDALMSQISLLSNTRLQTIRDYVNEAQPLTKNDEIEVIAPPVDPRDESVDEEDLSEVRLVNVDKLKEEMASNRTLKLALRIMCMSLSNESTRRYLLNKRQRFPRMFSGFMDDLEKVADKNTLLMEYFTDKNFVEFVIEQVSPLYSLMTPEELREQYQFLWKEFDKSIANDKQRKKDQIILTMLSDNEGGTADYFAQLLRNNA